MTRAPPIKHCRHDNRYLREDGSNLAALLYRLRHKEPTSYDMIVRTVRLVAPFFDDFVLEPQALNEDTIRLVWRHRGSDAFFGASSLSDGTLRFIALATLLLQPASLQPSVILLDEPELGLHPYAITVFCSLVKQCSVDKQIVLATQSPLIVDHFEPEDVLVADRVAGRTEIRRLEQDRLGEWLQDYSLGELWQKNEFGGRPLPEEMRGSMMGSARQRDRRGGVRPWPSVCRDIVNHLREDRSCFATTMVDYYGMPHAGQKAWPGRAASLSLASSLRAQTVEGALAADVGRRLGRGFDSRRLAVGNHVEAAVGRHLPLRARLGIHRIDLARRHADPRRRDCPPLPAARAALHPAPRARADVRGQTEARNAPPALSPAFSPASLPLKCLSSSSMETPPP